MSIKFPCGYLVFYIRHPLLNGHLYILRDGRTYTVTGAEVK